MKTTFWHLSDADIAAALVENDMLDGKRLAALRQRQGRLAPVSDYVFVQAVKVDGEAYSIDLYSDGTFWWTGGEGDGLPVGGPMTTISASPEVNLRNFVEQLALRAEQSAEPKTP